jgi:hypothetical protein
MTDVKLILDELMTMLPQAKEADKLPEWCAFYALAYMYYVSERSKTWTPPNQ